MDSGDDGNKDELDDFLAEAKETKGGTKRPVPAPVEDDDDREPTLADAEREAERMTRSERAKAAYRASAPTVQWVGAGPVPDTRPKCHFCGTHKWLSPGVVRTPDGKDVRLCRGCVSILKEDRAKRCVSCGEPSSLRLLDGLCVKCRADGGKALANLIALIKLRWVGVVDEK